MPFILQVSNVLNLNLQEMLFRMAGLPMVENCLSGYNSCMFAYGQVILGVYIAFTDGSALWSSFY